MFISAQDAQRIVDEVKTMVRRDVNFMNREGIIIASTDPERLQHIHEGAKILLQERLDRLDIREPDAKKNIRMGINLAVRVEGRTEGVIGITGDPDELSNLGTVIQKMTEIMIAGLRQRAEAELLDRAQNILLENWLLGSDLNTEELEHRGNLLGIECRIPRRIAVLKISDSGQGSEKASLEIQHTRFLTLIQKRIRFDSQNFCTILRNRIVILFASCSRQKIETHLEAICQEIHSFYGNMVYGGIGPEVQDPEQLQRSYHLAGTACDLAMRDGKRAIMLYDDLSLPFLVRCIPQSVRCELSNQIFGRCTPAEQQEILETIRLYFKAEGSAESAANMLYVHKNTFQYRIEKVRKRTGLSLRVPTESILLYIAMELSQQ